MKRILIYDRSISGHNPEWIYCATKAAIKLGMLPVVAACHKAESVRHWMSKIETCNYISVFADENRMVSFLNATQIADRFGCSSIFFPYFDTIINEIGDCPELIYSCTVDIRGVVLRLPDLTEKWSAKDNVAFLFNKLIRTKSMKLKRRKMRHRRRLARSEVWLRAFKSSGRSLKLAFVEQSNIDPVVEFLKPFCDCLQISVDPWLSRSNLTKQEARSRLGLPHGKYIFLHSGTSYPVKGLGDAVIAFDNLPESIRNQCLFVRAGTVKGPHLADLANWGIFHDNRYIPQDELDDYFSASDCVLMPYRGHTGSSGTLVHAAANGRPVVAPNFSVVGKKVSDYGLGYLYKHLDLESLAGAMQVAFESDYMPGANARAYVAMNTESDFIKVLADVMN